MRKSSSKLIILYFFTILLIIFIISIDLIAHFYHLELQTKSILLFLFLLFFLIGIFINYFKINLNKKIYFFLFIPLIMIISIIPLDNSIGPSIIMSDGSFCNKYVSTKFYEPKYFFFKKEFHWDTTHDLQLLKAKYGITFIAKKNSNNKHIYFSPEYPNIDVCITHYPCSSNAYGTDSFSNDFATQLAQNWINSGKFKAKLIHTDTKKILICQSSDLQKNFSTYINMLIKKIQENSLLKNSQVVLYYQIQEGQTLSEVQSITIDNTLGFLETKLQSKLLKPERIESQIYILYYQLENGNTSFPKSS